MERKDIENFVPHAGHAFPTTRREFLQQGLIGFSAAALIPTLPAIAWNAIHRERSLDPFVPFLVFDCAGGAALPANFLVGGKGGAKDVLKSYSRLGWDPGKEGIDEQFGLPMAAKSSQIRQGILNTTSAEARACLRMGSLCHFADSDSGANPLSAFAFVASSGYQGSVLRKGLGTEASDSGGFSAAAGGSPSLKPLNIFSVDDLVNNISLSNLPFSGAPKGSLRDLFFAASKVSALQSKAFEASTEGKALSKALQGSYQENANNIESNTFDPRKDPQFQSTYQITPDSAPNNKSVVFATAVRGVLHGQTGPAVLTIGDCDYHDNTSTTGDLKDLEIGTHIGRAVQAAHLLQKPLFFQILTDGGCANFEGTRIWRSDANDKCMTIVGLYQPTKAPALLRDQVGYYTEGQGAAKDGAKGLGNSPYKAACAVFANYLSLRYSGAELGREFARVVPQSPFDGQEELESVLMFG